jgi:HEPN domain-containing protein
MADSMNYKDWYYKARKDREYAKILFEAELAEDNLDYSGTSFHCQQCIEKYLKGFILKETGKHINKTHDLLYLCRQAAKKEAFFEQLRPGCKLVNEFYTESRYPADFTLVNKDEARVCLNAADKIHEFITETESQPEKNSEKK